MPGSLVWLDVMRRTDAVKNVVVRADASLTIGQGHVVRCLSLASGLRERGATVTFVSREDDGDLSGPIEGLGFDVARLPALGGESAIDVEQACSVDSAWRHDAEQTTGVIRDRAACPDWLVVDSYALDSLWEASLRPSARRILAIDDLADRPHDCDVLLDQNLVAGMETRYAGRVPAGCELLLGPRYALLQPIYAELHGRTPPRAGAIRRMLVFFGGADLDNLTGRVVAAFLALHRADIELDVVISAGSPCAPGIRRQVAGHANIVVHCDLPTLAPLIAKADVAIGAAGATTWERLCLGLPSVVITLASNQEPIALELHRRGLVHLLGRSVDVDETMIRAALLDLVGTELDAAWSERCSHVVDGRGTARVLDRLYSMDR